MNRIAVFVLALSLAAPASAHEGVEHRGCAHGQVFEAGDLAVSRAFTREMLPNAQAAGGYLTIENKGTEADTLRAVTTEAARVVQLHSMTMDGDIMKMAELPEGIEVPAGETTTLTPGGTHMMMLAVKTPFKEGECLEMTLEFAKAGLVPVVLEVGSPAADGPSEHAGHGM